MQDILRKEKTMANCSYSIVSNWDKYPNFKAIRFVTDRGAARTICKCGYWTKECHQNTSFKCPVCNNTDITDIPSVQEKCSVNWGTSPCLRKYSERTNVYAKNGTDFVTISTTTYSRETTSVSECLWYEVKPYTTCPEWKNYPQMEFAVKIMESFDQNLSCINKLWEPICLATKEFQTKDEVLNAIDFFGGPYDFASIFHGTNYYRPSEKNCIKNTIKEIQALPEYLHPMAKKFELIRYFIWAKKSHYLTKIPPTLAEYLVNVYENNQISAFIQTIVDKCQDIPESISELIIQFMKEKCFSKMNSDEVAYFIMDIKSGKRPKSVKDYYLQKSRDKFVAAYGQKKVDKALEDVYNKPAEAFIALANLK